MVCCPACRSTGPQEAWPCGCGRCALPTADCRSACDLPFADVSGEVMTFTPSLRVPPRRDLVQRWQALARESRTRDTLLAIMREFLDPAYATYTVLEKIGG